MNENVKPMLKFHKRVIIYLVYFYLYIRNSTERVKYICYTNINKKNKATIVIKE